MLLSVISMHIYFYSGNWVNRNSSPTIEKFNSHVCFTHPQSPYSSSWQFLHTQLTTWKINTRYLCSKERRKKFAVVFSPLDSPTIINHNYILIKIHFIAFIQRQRQIFTVIVVSPKRPTNGDEIEGWKIKKYFSNNAPKWMLLVLLLISGCIRLIYLLLFQTVNGFIITLSDTTCTNLFLIRTLLIFFWWFPKRL